VARVDFGALWRTIEDAVRAFAPGGAGGEGQDPIKMVEAPLGLSLKDDLIAPLGEQIAFFQRAAKAPAADPEFAVLLDLKDREKLQATLEKLFALAPFFQRSEYLGRSVWALNVPGAAPGDGGDGMPAVSLCVMDTHLVVAQSKAIVEEVLRRVGKEVKSIKDTSDFKALSGLFPASATFLSYESPQSYAELIDEMKEALKELTEEPGEEEGDDGSAKKAEPEGFEAKMEKLALELVAACPEGKVLARHLAGAVMWSFTEDRGIGLTHQILLRKAPK
jgi:hypothetical protein